MNKILRSYLIIGIIGGLLFPALGSIVALNGAGLPFSFSNLIHVHTTSNLLLIIDLAPFVLIPISIFLGTKQVALDEVLKLLTVKNKDQNVELANLNLTLKRRNDDFQSLAYVTGHELKSNLRGISSLCSFLKEETDEKEIIKNNELLEARIVRMDNSLSGLLRYIKISQLENRLEKFDLKGFFKQIDEHFEDENVTISYFDLNQHVVLDKLKLRQIFKEIIRNSIDFSDKSQVEVEIKVVQGNQQIKFTIEDNGPGIEAEYEEKIFNMFATLERKDVRDTTGLGLAIVKRITEDMNGTVKLIDGKGTTFELIFNQ